MKYVYFEDLFDKILIKNSETSLKKVYELQRLATKPDPTIKAFFKDLVAAASTGKEGIVNLINSYSKNIVKKPQYSDIPDYISGKKSSNFLRIRPTIRLFCKTQNLSGLLQEKDYPTLQASLCFLYKMVEYARLIELLDTSTSPSIYDKDKLLLCLLKDEFPDIVDDDPIQLDRASMENVKSSYPGSVNTSAYHALLVANQHDYKEVSLVTFNGVVLFGLREEQIEKLIEIDSFIKDSLARNASPEEIAQKITQILIDWDPGRGKTLLCELVTKAYGQTFYEKLMVDGRCFGRDLDNVPRIPFINVQWLSLKDITEEEGTNLDEAIKYRIKKMIRSAPKNRKITIIIDEYPAMAYAQQKVINKLLPPDKYNLIFISATNNSVVQHKKTAPEECTDENRLNRENYSIHSIALTNVQDIETFTKNYNGNIPVIVKGRDDIYIIGYNSSNDKIAHKLDNSSSEYIDLIKNIKWTNKPQLIQDINILKTAKKLIKERKLHYPLVPSHKLELTRTAFYKQLKQSTDKLDIKCIDEDQKTLIESLVQNTKSKLESKQPVSGDIQYILPDITTKEQQAFIEELKTQMKELDVDAILYQEIEGTISEEEVVKIKYIKRIKDVYHVETLKDNEIDIPGFNEKNRCLQIFSKANAVGGDYRKRARNVALQVIHSNSYLSYDQLMQYGNRHRTDEPAVEIYKQHETIVLSKAKGIEELIAAAQRKQNNYEYKNALNVFRSDIIRSLFPSIDHQLYDQINCRKAVKLIMNHIRDKQAPDLKSILLFINQQVKAVDDKKLSLAPKIYNSFSNLIQYYDTLLPENTQNIQSTISKDISRYKGCLHEMGSIDYMPQKQQATIGGGGKITKLGVDLTDELDSKEKLDGKRKKLYTHSTGKGIINDPELVNGFNKEYLSCLERMTKVCGKISSQYSKLYPQNPQREGDSVRGSTALNFDQCLSQFHALAKAKIGCDTINNSKSEDLVDIMSNVDDINKKAIAINKLQSETEKLHTKISQKFEEHCKRVINLLKASINNAVSATDEKIAFNLQNLLLIQKYKNLNILSDIQFDELKNAYLDILDKQLAGQNTVENSKEVLTSKITEWLGAFKGSQDLDGKILERPKEWRLALQKDAAKVNEQVAKETRLQRELLQKQEAAQIEAAFNKLKEEEQLIRDELDAQAIRELGAKQQEMISGILANLQTTQEVESRTLVNKEQQQEYLHLALTEIAHKEEIYRKELSSSLIRELGAKHQEMLNTQEEARQLGIASSQLQEQEHLARTELELMEKSELSTQHQEMLSKRLKDLQEVQKIQRRKLLINEQEIKSLALTLEQQGFFAKEKLLSQETEQLHQKQHKERIGKELNKLEEVQEKQARILLKNEEKTDRLILECRILETKERLAIEALQLAETNTHNDTLQAGRMVLECLQQESKIRNDLAQQEDAARRELHNVENTAKDVAVMRWQMEQYKKQVEEQQLVIQELQKKVVGKNSSKMRKRLTELRVAASNILPQTSRTLQESSQENQNIISGTGQQVSHLTEEDRSAMELLALLPSRPDNEPTLTAVDRTSLDPPNSLDSVIPDASNPEQQLSIKKLRRQRRRVVSGQQSLIDDFLGSNAITTGGAERKGRFRTLPNKSVDDGDESLSRRDSPRSPKPPK